MSTPCNPIWNLPNILTLLRIAAIPLLMVLMTSPSRDAGFWSAALFSLASITDWLDGHLARRMNIQTILGTFLDPMADKLLLVCVYVTLAAIGVLPDWLAILVVFRDLVIVGGVLVLWVLGEAPKIRPLMVSKLNTVTQIVLAGVALLLAGFGLRADALLWAMVWTVAGTTVASGAAYVAAVQETAATVDEITHSGAQISKRASDVIASAPCASVIEATTA